MLRTGREKIDMRNRPLAVAGLALVLATGASLPAAAQLPGVDVPEVDVPDVQVPEVTVPDVPGVDVPEVRVPPVQVPSVQVAPEVETPAVEAGGVQAGGSAPAPATDGDGSSGGGSTAGGGGGSAGGGSGSAASGTAVTRTRSTASGGSAGAAPARAAAAGASRSSTSSARDDAPGSRRARDRRLRRLVTASRSCLGMLPAAQRRVLVLRAGLGPRDPRSRRATAARLDLPLDTVRRRERAGLRELRALDGSCGGATGATTMTVAPTTAAASPAAAATGPAAATATTAADDAAGRGEPEAGGVLGESESAGRTGGTDTPATVIPSSLPSDGGDASVFVLGALAAALLALLANPRSREWILHPED
jgi:hypothetical protein